MRSSRRAAGHPDQWIPSVLGTRDQGADHAGSGAAAAGAALPSDTDLTAWAEALNHAGTGLDDAQRIDLIRALEVLKCAAEGAQAELACDFDLSQRRAAAQAGVRAERQGRGVSAQVALARRESPHRGSIHLGTAKILRLEMPHTWDAFRAGRISEWRATLMVRETACLTLPDRQEIDRRLAADADRIEGVGDGELVGEARKIAYALEPRAFVERRKNAESERRVSLRPAPEGMALFSALLPVKHGVAMYAVLGREADRLRAAGDQRTRGQLMADLLVERVTNPVADSTGTPGGVGVTVNLVVPADVLLGDSDEGGHVEGFGPVPGDVLREWIADLADDETADDVRVWVRRVYERPGPGDLVAMDSQSRRFTGRLAEFLRLRDQRCRTRWCDAPVRHLDHAEAWADGGQTSAANGQGLCETCNHAKQARGWLARVIHGPPDTPHTVETTTPTGHTHTSPAPATRPARPARVDIRWRLDLVA